MGNSDVSEVYLGFGVARTLKYVFFSLYSQTPLEGLPQRCAQQNSLGVAGLEDFA